MDPSPRSDVTAILHDLGARKIDSRQAMDELYPVVYSELRRVAGGIMRAQRSDHTLQPTALVHEAYVKLVNQRELAWNDRAHFFNVAARAMRHILVNYARERSAEKRGGGAQRVTLDERFAGDEGSGFLDVLALNEALDALAKEDERMMRIVELRVFAGMTVKETAHVLDISERTVKSDWKFAKVWLLEFMEG